MRGRVQERVAAWVMKSLSMTVSARMKTTPASVTVRVLRKSRVPAKHKSLHPKKPSTLWYINALLIWLPVIVTFVWSETMTHSLCQSLLGQSIMSAILSDSGYYRPLSARLISPFTVFLQRLFIFCHKCTKSLQYALVHDLCWMFIVRFPVPFEYCCNECWSFLSCDVMFC